MSALEICCNRLRVDNEYWRNIDRKNYHKKVFHLDYSYDKYSSNKKIYKDDIEVNGIGFVIKNEFKYYIITCYHVVKNCHNIYTKIMDNKVKLNILSYFQEFDLAILQIDSTFENIFDEYLESIKCPIENKIPNTNDEIILNTIVDGKQEKFISSKFDIVCHSVLNIFNPDTLLLGLRFNINKNILSGLSGSPLFHNNKLIGFLSFVNNETNTIYFIASYLINYSLNLTKMNLLPKTLKLKGKPISIKINGKNKTGYMINKDINIDYESNSPTGKINFNKNIIITKINNQEIDESGNIYMDEIDCYVNPEIYCFLTNNRSQIVEIEYFNINELDKDLTTEKVELMDYYNVSCISLNGYDKCLFYNNLVFMEINQNIIENIHIDDKFNMLINEPYGHSNKTIVLLDLLESLQNSSNNKKIKEINKIYKNKSTNLILQKINNIEFSCLEELENILLDIPTEKKILFSFQKDTSELINVLL